MVETKKEIKDLKDRLGKESYKPIVSPMKGWRTKSGEVISWNEFFERWKIAMQNLSPAQRTLNDINSNIIILVGFIASTIALIFFNKTFGLVTYGLIIIFLGNIYSNIIKLFSLFGQLKIYKNIEKEVNYGH